MQCRGDQILHCRGRLGFHGFEAVDGHNRHSFKHGIVKALGQRVLDEQFLKLQAGARNRQILIAL